jgi:hypothetical protein
MIFLIQAVTAEEPCRIYTVSMWPIIRHSMLGECKIDDIPSQDAKAPSSDAFTLSKVARISEAYLNVCG